MNRIMLVFGLLIAVSVLAILFVLSQFVYTLIDPLVLLAAAGFVVIFGFLVGIKLMSEL
jgi:voltage-gated potassium channel Kch